MNEISGCGHQSMSEISITSCPLVCHHPKHQGSLKRTSFVGATFTFILTHTVTHAKCFALMRTGLSDFIQNPNP
ncbi:hypothetical protein BLOT_014141 [Blomia tropicalis]|nr:hypothetical protein BLOT_014141 [Blomia tropicalis]